jgi:hypothetical protein
MIPPQSDEANPLPAASPQLSAEQERSTQNDGLEQERSTQNDGLGTLPPGSKKEGLIRLAQTILEDAIARIPSLKYAVGVVGVSSAAFLASVFFGFDLPHSLVAVFGMMVLMAVLASFSVASNDQRALRRTSRVMLYSFSVIGVAIPGMLMTSAFFAYPLDLTGWIVRTSRPSQPAASIGPLPAPNAEPYGPARTLPLVEGSYSAQPSEPQGDITATVASNDEPGYQAESDKGPNQTTSRAINKLTALEILSIDKKSVVSDEYGKQSTIDVVLANTGQYAAVTKSVSLEVVSGNNESCRDVLLSTGEYQFDLSSGNATERTVHFIRPREADRITLLLHHGCRCCTESTLRISVNYNGSTVRQTVAL